MTQTASEAPPPVDRFPTLRLLFKNNNKSPLNLTPIPEPSTLEKTPNEAQTSRLTLKIDLRRAQISLKNLSPSNNRYQGYDNLKPHQGHSKHIEPSKDPPRNEPEETPDREPKEYFPINFKYSKSYNDPAHTHSNNWKRNNLKANPLIRINLNSRSSSGLSVNSKKVLKKRSLGKKTRIFRKRDRYEIFARIVSSLKHKDYYGFFLKPVDVSVFTDYTSIISKPMDLETMTNKVINKEYLTIADLKADLELLVNNAKIYNPEGSVYYRSATKLWEWGVGVMDRESSKIAPYTCPEEVKTDVDETNNDKLVVTKRTHTRKRRKLLQELETRLRSFSKPDFTFKAPKNFPKFSSFDMYINQTLSQFVNSLCYESKLVTTIHEKLALLSGPYSFLSTPETKNEEYPEEILDVYGGELGIIYSKSMDKFTENLSGVVRDECWKNINNCTKGCCAALKNAVELLSSDIDLGVRFIKNDSKITTEYGEFNVAERIATMKSYSLNSVRAAQIEMLREGGLDTTPLVKPLVMEIKDPNFTKEMNNLSLVEMLTNNVIDMADYLRMSSEVSTELGMQLMEKIRRRLLILVESISSKDEK